MFISSKQKQKKLSLKCAPLTLSYLIGLGVRSFQINCHMFKVINAQTSHRELPENNFPCISALGPTQPPIQWVPGALSLGVKRLRRETDHSPPSSAEVKNACSYTSTPQYVIIAWCLVKHSLIFSHPHL